MPIDQEKLAKLQKLSANNKVGGSSAGANKDDTKLQSQLAKLHAVTIDNVAEANFFKDDGKVMHFNKVGVQVAAQHNTSVFYGLPQEKNLQDLFPAIQALSQLAAQMEKHEAKAPADAEKKDEAIPELVEGQTFDADVE
ncbi:Nascent polypeptide-associated complex subunit beta [Fusarium oxysporum]|nr:Nascent polypeptide-associated complex subunit beta [Fusarium oxysporum]